jgi:Tfp pilus tip-associated adhesin PilY1
MRNSLMKSFNKKVLSASVSMTMTLAICGAIPMSSASDIEIYSDSTKGKTSILLMLDTSGSMGISSLVLPKDNKYGSPGDVDVALCDRVSVSEYYSDGTSTSNIYQWAYNLKDSAGKTAIKKTVTIGGVTVPYYVRGCTKGGVTQYDRLSRLKDAILPLLASNELSDEVVMGLGQFSSKTELSIGTAKNKLTDGHSGRILVPNSALTSIQRIKIAQEIAAIKSLDTTTNEDGTPNTDLKLSSKNYPNVTKASSGTPTAHAYAEAAAYMMGTTTGAGGANSGVVDTIYDGYMVMQNGSEQVYFICVEVGSTNTSALGATVKQCVNNWPTYDSDNKTVGTGTISGGIYKPDGSGGWTRVNSQTAFKNEVAAMNSGWETFKKLPEGWRYGGWMKVNNEPMDIEPIVGTVWGGYAGGTIGIVSYRTNPFSVRSQTVTKTRVVQGFQDCPAGFSPISSWRSLCQSSATKQSRSATPSERANNNCSAPAFGEDPMIGARDPNGNLKNDEHYNMARTSMEGSGNSRKCVQTDYAVVRPWGDVIETYTELEPLENNGGFAYSADDTKNGNVYRAGGSTNNSCNGNGIYFLTDGAPNSTKVSMAQEIMNTTLNNNSYKFTGKPSGNGVLVSPTLNSGLFSGETGGWEYIGEYAKKLRNRTTLSNTQKNPVDMNIKTAVVGFGSSFAGIPKNTDGTYNCEAIKSTNLDAYNACKWGSSEFGDGGFYYAENAADIKQSIIDFVKKAEVKIDPVLTGSPTTPVDSLNPTQIQKNAYYASFTPTVSSSSQLWIGNLNKYQVLNGELYSADGLQRLIAANGSLNKAAAGFWADGTLGQLNIGALIGSDNMVTTNRKIYTNRVMNGATASSGSSLQVLDLAALFGGSFNLASDKNYWLNALGYNVPIAQTGVTLANLSTYSTFKQLGAVMHSTPILLTQEGKIKVVSGELTTTDRKDYLLYGSTQGVLHVVDVATGKEVFGFIPDEVMKNQPSAFLPEDKTAGGSSNLFYGIDAPWVAHTKYTTKTSGLLTVNASDRTLTDEDDSEKLSGYQWVYGGLRMGGKSYYALDLSDIQNPNLKFHINPDAIDASQPLKRMGQSWSKPTLAYVNWGGAKKLVMFVGGGYDAKGTVVCTADTTKTNKGYECPTYQQNNKEGAGVYMFDANNGELLWWSSVDNNSTPVDSDIRFTENADLKYSVVSQINTIDRNSDGLVDHLYFGDLAGQAFRVDINNAPKLTGTPTVGDLKNNFVKRVVTLFSEQASSGLSPRFYEMPSVSIHVDPVTGKSFAAVAYSSGNRSSPLIGTVTAGESTITASAKDGVFVVYDNDVASKNLYDATYTPVTVKKSLEVLTLANGVSRSNENALNGGWKYLYSNTPGAYKGMNDLYALDGMLYVNVYHKDGVGIQADCGGGVKGDSYLYQFCLPFGKCSFYGSTTTEPNKVKLGTGILGTGIGQGYTNQKNTLGLVVNRDDPTTLDCTKVEHKNKPQCQLFDNSTKLKQMRWYETQ